MSYILDALKKSERQRPPGPVPDLFTVQGPQPAAPRRPAAAIAAALLLLSAALGAGVWLLARRPAEAPVTAPLTASAPPSRAVVPEPTVPLAAPAPSRSEVAPPPTKSSLRKAVVAARPAPPVPAKRPQSTIASPAAANPENRPLPAPARPADAAPVAAPGSASAAAPLTGFRVPIPVPATVPVSAVPDSAQTAEIAAEPLPPADGRILELAELPAPVRAALPALRVSAHVWSEEPALRLVSVDDRLLHEGGEAAPGVVLREITPTGAVFAFRGWSFRVSGGRP